VWVLHVWLFHFYPFRSTFLLSLATRLLGVIRQRKPPYALILDVGMEISQEFQGHSRVRPIGQCQYLFQEIDLYISLLAMMVSFSFWIVTRSDPPHSAAHSPHTDRDSCPLPRSRSGPCSGIALSPGHRTGRGNSRDSAPRRVPGR